MDCKRNRDKKSALGSGYSEVVIRSSTTDKITICKLDRYNYIVDSFDFLVYFKHHKGFKCQALRQAILIFNPMATFTEKSNLKALNSGSENNIRYIGKHFFKSGLASKLISAGVKYDII